MNSLIGEIGEVVSLYGNFLEEMFYKLIGK